MAISGLVVAALAFGASGCKHATAMEKLRDALAEDSLERVAEVTKEIVGCRPPLPVAPTQGCLPEMATAFGSKTGFAASPPDQASAASVALLLVREHRGDWAPLADQWMTAMKVGKGAGADSLRLAVAHNMAEAAEAIGKAVVEDPDGVALLKAVTQSVPGACASYAMLGDGALPEKMPPAMAPDHDPCVQRDLSRKVGPGGDYGVGLWRAAAGAIALWKDESAALKAGLSLMDGKAKETVEAKLATIEAATAKSSLKKSEPRVNAALDIGSGHGGGAMAAPTLAPADAGAAHAADAAAPLKKAAHP